MLLTNPDRNTISGRKQAGRLLYRRNRANKAKYNAEYYKKNKYNINRTKAVRRGNSRKQRLKGTIVTKWNINWDPEKRIVLLIFLLFENPSCVDRDFRLALKSKT